ncbi:hypothetical protein OG858_47430 (plasmid) [Streptomyces europaeiscabiei]|uniref:hypothetical protein n=1 Tax=Streptomyces europaeiscabiei TaxID=146819 RepID=UPI002E804EA5|nr:hypothetical protein [Streptomyces europaeiscabiei]WUD38832.1 hypothetical protein OG858_47430 [Streptomyces europaeiscabiei]
MSLPNHRPVPLPVPLRVLDLDEFQTAVHAARREAQRYRPRLDVDHGMAEEMVSAALATAGVFIPAPAPESLDTECCTALYLPWEPEAATAETLGVWQQCGDEPGHDDADGHDNGEFTWVDGRPGTVPAQLPHPTDEETGA